MTIQQDRLERRAVALAGEIHTAYFAGQFTAEEGEAALKEIGGLESLAALLNLTGSLTEAGLRFANGMIEDTREWLEGLEPCGVCGDHHGGNAPLACETGDGV